ncbi:MAG: winged helix-turn-helix domain-containing protein [Chloroflexi bacterium]|nr:winged helix-turn-helix domain-containing protein [Chloroflexota bacterium]
MRSQNSGIMDFRLDTTGNNRATVSGKKLLARSATFAARLLSGPGFVVLKPKVRLETSIVPALEPVKKSGSYSLLVYCLGSFRVYQHEQLIEKWISYKSRSIFKYLLTHRERPIHREILMELFWPEADPEFARRNLHQAIFNLRQTLQTGCADLAHILFEDGCYYLNPELDIYLDSEAFIRHYQTGQRLEREGYLAQAIKAYELADSLYAGELLAEDLYEDWTREHRENLKRTHLDILDRLSQFYFDRGQFTLCMSLCYKLLAEDNCFEEAHRRLMGCYFGQGQRHLAIRQYHLCVEILERELALPPMPATVELYRQIQGHRVQR